MFENIREVAQDVVSNVFETMFFILSNSCEDDRHEEEPLRFSPTIFRGEIGFRGNRSGRLILSVPYELAKMMAINFMGLEDGEISESQTMDVVGELCNVICGNLFARLDKKNTYVLTMPRTQSISPQEMDDGNHDSGITIDFDAEGHQVKFDLQFEP